MSFNRTEVKLSNWPFGVKMYTYVSMRLDARNTMVFQFSTFLSSKVICKNVDLTKKQHFCLTFPGKVKMRPKVVKSGMVGFRTSQAFRSPLLRNSITIRGQMNWRGWHPTPRCGLGWRNSRWCGQELNTDVSCSSVCDLAGVVPIYQHYHLRVK